MKRRAFIASALGAAATAKLAAPALAQAPLEIKVAAATAADHSAVFIAVERGIFARNGLDAKVQLFQTGVEMVNSMVGNTQDVAVLGSTPPLTGIANGMPLMIIGHLHGDATVPSYSGSNTLVASGASGVTPSDFRSMRGKRVGLPRGTGAEAHLRGILEGVGLSLNDVTLVNLGPGNLPTALRNGDVDVISGWEPWASISTMRVAGAVRIVHGQCSICYDPGTILSTRAAIGAKAEPLRRFALSFAEAHQWLRQNFDAAADINMRWIQGVDLDVMRVAIRQSTYDMRISRNTIEGYNTKAIPALLADRRIPRAYDVTPNVDAQFYLHAERTGPQFFSDLPAIPANQRIA